MTKKKRSVYRETDFILNMKKKNIIQTIETIKRSCLNIDKDLFKDEKSYDSFLNLFCESWVFTPLEEIKKEVLK